MKAHIFTVRFTRDFSDDIAVTHFDESRFALIKQFQKELKSLQSIYVIVGFEPVNIEGQYFITADFRMKGTGDRLSAQNSLRDTLQALYNEGMAGSFEIDEDLKESLPADFKNKHLWVVRVPMEIVFSADPDELDGVDRGDEPAPTPEQIKAYINSGAIVCDFNTEDYDQLTGNVIQSISLKLDNGITVTRNFEVKIPDKRKSKEEPLSFVQTTAEQLMDGEIAVGQQFRDGMMQWTLIQRFGSNVSVSPQSKLPCIDVMNLQDNNSGSVLMKDTTVYRFPSYFGDAMGKKS